MALRTWQETTDQLEEGDLTSWKPDPGEAIAGRVTNIATNTGTNGDSTLADIETENGAHVGVWLSTGGDVVGIKYFGTKAGKNGGHASNAGRPSDDFEDDMPF